MRILYVGVHEVLEYDELRILTALGHEVIVMGSYTDPRNQNRLRPDQPGLNPDSPLMQLALNSRRDALPEALIDPMDVIIVMHEPQHLLKNWARLRHKRVIWRTIGQSVWFTEEMLAGLRADGLQIVRCSPAEARIPGCLGSDALIRFGKDPAEYAHWSGSSPGVISFTQYLLQRGVHCSSEMVQQMASALPFTLYGGGNESLTFAGGMLSLDEQKKVLRTARAYFNANTHPASYTLSFIEAWMTGIPVVSVGPMLGNPRNAEYTQETFEVPDLITDGVNGYCSDDPQRLRTVLQDLLNDEALARSIGAAGRGRAIELFGIESVRDQWRQFLG
jgi:hypothetical protein